MINDYRAACEKIANDPNVPARIADWADELYMNFDGYKNGKHDAGIMIRIEDLMLIEKIIEEEMFGYDEGYAIGLIDCALCRR